MFAAFGMQIESLDNLASKILAIVEQTSSESPRELDTTGRRRLVERLDSFGFFELNDSIDVLADRCLVSRVTIYTDIKKTRLAKTKNIK